MNTLEAALLEFLNIFEIAGIFDFKGDVYRKQEGLAAECRQRKVRFLAIMPLRSLFSCERCNMKTGEALLHFEDPSQRADGHPQDGFLSSRHLHIVVRRSVLHAVCAHNDPAPPEVSRFLDRIEAKNS